VEGRINGLRIRRNFPTREEANAERMVLEILTLQAEAGFRAVATGLTDEQLRDAEAAFGRLTGKSLSLSSCIDFALSNYREPEHDKRLPEAR
jgi:hypothetical protein